MPGFLLLIPYVETNGGQLSFDPPLWILLALTVASTVYEVVMVALRGQTVGKITMGIQVVRQDTVQPPSWSHSGIRALVPAVAGGIPGVGLFASLAVYLTAVFTPRRQGIHDFAAGSVVVSAR